MKKSLMKSIKFQDKIQSSMLNESHDRTSRSINSEQTSIENEQKLEADARK
jgi:hypothetical protein